MNSHRPRIFHLTPSLKVGGAERLLLFTLPRLQEFKHTVICLQGWGNIGDELRKKNIDVRFIPSRNIFSLASARAFGALVRELQPDLLISCLPPADFFARIWGNYYRVPRLLCHLHSTMRDWRYLPLVWINNASQHFVDGYIAVSNAVKQRYENMGLTKGITQVIHNGIPVEPEDPNGPPLPSSPFPRIGYVAQMRKERGHIFLFHVLEHLLRRKINIQLTFIGDGPYRTNLEAEARRRKFEPYVQFLGQRNDVASLLPQLTLYAHPSLYEGMSVALLESMRAGCAIITTDIPENREVLGSPPCARLVPPKNPETFADAIEDLLKNPRIRQGLSAQAQARFRDHFSIDETVQALNDHFHRVIQRPPSQHIRRIFTTKHP